jgi:hypothetical protein
MRKVVRAEKEFKHPTGIEVKRLLGSKNSSLLGLRIDIEKLGEQKLDETIIKSYIKTNDEIIKTVEQQGSRIKLLMGKDYDVFLSKLKEIRGNLEQTRIIYRHLLHQVLLTRDKLWALTAELGLNVKPVIKKFEVSYNAPVLGSYHSDGNMLLGIGSLSRSAHSAELTVAHEFAHSMQPLVKADIAEARSQQYRVTIKIMSKLSRFSKSLNELIENYNFGYIFTGKIMVWFRDQEHVKLEKLNKIQDISSVLKAVLIAKESPANLFKDVFGVLGKLSWNLKLCYRVLSYRIKTGKITDKETIQLAANLPAVLKHVYDIGRELKAIASEVFMHIDEISGYSVYTKITEGFASVMEYLYGKKYGVAGTDAAIMKSSYGPIATRAYMLYLKKPQILRGIFVGSAGGIKSWNSICQQLDHIEAELKNINFK